MFLFQATFSGIYYAQLMTSSKVSESTIKALEKNDQKTLQQVISTISKEGKAPENLPYMAAKNLMLAAIDGYRAETKPEKKDLMYRASVCIAANYLDVLNYDYAKLLPFKKEYDRLGFQIDHSPVKANTVYFGGITDEKEFREEVKEKHGEWGLKVIDMYKEKKTLQDMIEEIDYRYEDEGKIRKALRERFGENGEQVWTLMKQGKNDAEIIEGTDLLRGDLNKIKALILTYKKAVDNKNSQDLKEVFRLIAKNAHPDMDGSQLDEFLNGGYSEKVVDPGGLTQQIQNLNNKILGEHEERKKWVEQKEGFGLGGTPEQQELDKKVDAGKLKEMQNLGKLNREQQAWLNELTSLQSKLDKKMNDKRYLEKQVKDCSIFNDRWDPFVKSFGYHEKVPVMDKKTGHPKIGLDGKVEMENGEFLNKFVIDVVTLRAWKVGDFGTQMAGALVDAYSNAVKENQQLDDYSSVGNALNSAFWEGVLNPGAYLDALPKFFYGISHGLTTTTLSFFGEEKPDWSFKEVTPFRYWWSEIREGTLPLLKTLGGAVILQEKERREVWDFIKSLVSVKEHEDKEKMLSNACSDGSPQNINAATLYTQMAYLSSGLAVLGLIPVGRGVVTATTTAFRNAVKKLLLKNMELKLVEQFWRGSTARSMEILENAMQKKLLKEETYNSMKEILAKGTTKEIEKTELSRTAANEIIGKLKVSIGTPTEMGEYIAGQLGFKVEVPKIGYTVKEGAKGFIKKVVDGQYYREIKSIGPRTLRKFRWKTTEPKEFLHLGVPVEGLDDANQSMVKLTIERMGRSLNDKYLKAGIKPQAAYEKSSQEIEAFLKKFIDKTASIDPKGLSAADIKTELQSLVNEFNAMYGTSVTVSSGLDELAIRQVTEKFLVKNRNLGMEYADLQGIEEGLTANDKMAFREIVALVNDTRKEVFSPSAIWKKITGKTEKAKEKAGALLLKKEAEQKALQTEMNGIAKELGFEVKEDIGNINASVVESYLKNIEKSKTETAVTKVKLKEIEKKIWKIDDEMTSKAENINELTRLKKEKGAQYDEISKLKINNKKIPLKKNKAIDWDAFEKEENALLNYEKKVKRIKKELKSSESVIKNLTEIVQENTSFWQDWTLSRHRAAIMGTLEQYEKEGWKNAPDWALALKKMDFWTPYSKATREVQNLAIRLDELATEIENLMKSNKLLSELGRKHNIDFGKRGNIYERLSSASYDAISIYESGIGGEEVKLYGKYCLDYADLAKKKAKLNWQRAGLVTKGIVEVGAVSWSFPTGIAAGSLATVLDLYAFGKVYGFAGSSLTAGTGTGIFFSIPSLNALTVLTASREPDPHLNLKAPPDWFTQTETQQVKVDINAIIPTLVDTPKTIEPELKTETIQPPSGKRLSDIGGYLYEYELYKAIFGRVEGTFTVNIGGQKEFAIGTAQASGKKVRIGEIMVDAGSRKIFVKDKGYQLSDQKVIVDYFFQFTEEQQKQLNIINTMGWSLTPSTDQKRKQDAFLKMMQNLKQLEKTKVLTAIENNGNRGAILGYTELGGNYTKDGFISKINEM